MRTVVDKQVVVRESDRDPVDTQVLLRNGDEIDLIASGSIWAGVWFTGSNGPRGWQTYRASDLYPLPGVPPFSLLGMTPDDGYFYVGNELRRTYQNESLGSGEARLYLRINDNKPGNGTGAFRVRILVRRNSDGRAIDMRGDESFPSEEQSMELQTRPINVQDPEFLHWSDNLRIGGETEDSVTDVHHDDLGQGEVLSETVRGDVSMTAEVLQPAEPDVAPYPIGPFGPPLTNFYAYRNSRPGVDWNTCGQAAIASMLDHYRKDPFNLPRVIRGSDGKLHWESGAIIDALKRAGYGPDVVFGFGTTGGRIRNALRVYGCNQAYEDHSGLFSAGWKDLWNRLVHFLRVQHAPVPVLVDLGALGGKYYTAHWAIAYRITASDDVYLGNCPRSVVSRRTFLHAWHCSFLPLGYNHCAVYYLRSWG